jgi:hypothetical protein
MVEYSPKDIEVYGNSCASKRKYFKNRHVLALIRILGYDP